MKAKQKSTKFVHSCIRPGKSFKWEFLGAKAPLGLVRVSQSVTNKKVGNFKILLNPLEIDQL